MQPIQSSYLLSIAANLAVNVQAGFWRMNCGRMLTGRVDPVVNPGAISAHAHNIVGGYSELTCRKARFRLS